MAPEEAGPAGILPAPVNKVHSAPGACRGPRLPAAQMRGNGVSGDAVGAGES